MDEIGFDGLTRMMRTRRGLGRALLGGGVASALARPTPAAAISCLANGDPCDPADAASCCTGTCKKLNGGHRSAPVGKALGCATSTETDYCATSVAVQCPEYAFGFCVVVRKKRKRQALCAVSGACADCRSDADCAPIIGSPTARCIKHCSACNVKMSLCVAPAPT